MDKKILTVAALVVVFAMGFLYLNQGYLAANDKDDNNSCGDKSSCTNSSACVNKSSCENKEVKAGGEWNKYEFTTDKACCEEMKADLKTNLSTVAGVKEVSFGNTCTASKMTHVTVYYSAGETSEESIAKFVSDSKYNCAGTECESKGCTKDGVKSGNMHEGCDGKNECTPKNEKKSSDTKKL